MALHYLSAHRELKTTRNIQRQRVQNEPEYQILKQSSRGIQALHPWGVIKGKILLLIIVYFQPIFFFAFDNLLQWNFLKLYYSFHCHFDYAIL